MTRESKRIGSSYLTQVRKERVEVEAEVREVERKANSDSITTITQKRTIDGKLICYHFCDSRWKPVDKTPPQITAAKKSTAANAAKLSAEAALLTVGGGAPAVAGITANLELTGIT
jgi:hypothetical protein